LWSDNAHPHDFEWLKAELSNFQNEGTLIIVSHLEYVQDFPSVLGFRGNSLSYAEGVIIVDDEMSWISWCRDIIDGFPNGGRLPMKA
jgi:hypothetical protein